jgi:hypothetical protein
MSFKNIHQLTQVEIPIKNHVGAFGVQRKKHVHNGVDLYCPPGRQVYAVEDGEVVDMRQWTGEDVGSPWWEDTYATLVEGKSGVVAYGEIGYGEACLWNFYYNIGSKIKRGDLIGWVRTVLNKDKGRPMTMLHLQMYKHGKTSAGGWDTNNPKPEDLIDPTLFLLDAEENIGQVGNTAKCE